MPPDTAEVPAGVRIGLCLVEFVAVYAGTGTDTRDVRIWQRMQEK